MKGITVREFIDTKKLSKLQITIIFICLASALLDGLDVVILGFIAPTLKADWGLSNSDLAPIMSAALAGLAFGALILGPIADKFGRKIVFCLCLVGFGSFTLLTARSDTISEMVILRFLTGIFMGGILPQIVTLITDYSPSRLRGRMVTLIIAGYAVGCASGGLLVTAFIEEHGWRFVLSIVGGLPLIMAILAYFYLPESLGFMVLKKYASEKIYQIALKIDHTFDKNTTQFVVPDISHHSSNPIKTLFERTYIVSTFGLWVCYGAAIYVSYLLSSWLPILISSNGFNHHEANLVSIFYQLGGPIGCIIAGFLIDKMDVFKGLLVTYVLAILSVLAAVIIPSSVLAYMLTCMSIGMWGGGIVAGLNSLSSTIYPLEVRSTGNSFMHSFARIGAVFSVFVGAMMLNAGFSAKNVFLSLLIPFSISVFVILLIKIQTTRHQVKIFKSTLPTV
ncbi:MULTISPECIES: MFS transporter [Acinetobacter calcoaceticus/baumannii complex]|uniref:MFS transporter n=1 Tax=Acinetobacter calcoaceticus/baumannii complex TaxID=909768 RepID=UPI002447DD06|nr:MULTISPECIES: aromatic acid/H+ symport family MFS transporter [Acinetobacter calcoaceticus/baumannii complex]MDH2595959.1 aromatic acid/H+ symport family MFS transporter [Acinetobacter baumannii]MDO7537221.1 aromatic acid/H+ symport family MFS transporter [Acinetobacter pittii]